MIKYCLTNWKAILKVESVKDGLARVSDPDCIDAGEFISTKDILDYWEGWRPKDKTPENEEVVEVLTIENIVTESQFINGRFQYDIDCEESTSPEYTPDQVILWRKPDSPY
jgi:hypothetical protein